MLLTVDIGNTGITIGVFDGDVLCETFGIPSERNMLQSEYSSILKKMLAQYSVDSCMIASVVFELGTTLKNAVDSLFEINSVLLNNNILTDFNLKIDNPTEAGADRIANAAAARKLYPLPVIVVDSGTATTLDIIDKEGDFIGGVIMPGINLQLKTLNKGTSKLPQVEAAMSEHAIGTNTRDAILSGVIRGHALAIEGLVKQCSAELREKPFVVATGGYSNLISKYMTFDEINQNLTIEGLKYLYKTI